MCLAISTTETLTNLTTCLVVANNNNCDACTVVCVACVYAARLLGCEGDGNAGARVTAMLV